MLGDCGQGAGVVLQVSGLGQDWGPWVGTAALRLARLSPCVASLTLVLATLSLLTQVP